MTMAPVPGGEAAVLSRVELVLPNKVVETCFTLDRGLGAEFLSTNLQRGTATRMKLFKQIDKSVRICVTVSSLQISHVHNHPAQPEHIFIQGVQPPPLPDPASQTDETPSALVSDTQAHSSTTTTADSPQPPALLSEIHNQTNAPGEQNIQSVDTLDSQQVSDSLTNNVEPDVPPDTDQGAEGNDAKARLQVAPQDEEPGGHSDDDLRNSSQDIEDTGQNVSPDAMNDSLEHSFHRGDVVPSEKVGIEMSHSVSDLHVLSVGDRSTMPRISDVNTPDRALLCAQVHDDPVLHSEEESDADVPVSSQTEKKPVGVKREREDDIDTVYRKLPTRNRRVPPRYEGEDYEEMMDRNMQVKQEDHDYYTSDSVQVEEMTPNGLPTLTVVLKPLDDKEMGEGEDMEVGEEEDEDAVEAEHEEKDNPEVSPKPEINQFLKDRSHMKRPHYKRERNIECPYCQAMLKDYESVADHVKHKHADETDTDEVLENLKTKMRVGCAQCGKMYGNKDLLRNHIRCVHREVAKAKCHICGLVVKSEKHLRGHKRRVHVKHNSSFLCHLCPASFRHQTYLNNHIRTVHSGNPADAFHCDKCDGTYATEKYLYNHKLRVHGEKKHTCKYCGKGFTNTANLKRHVLLLHERSNEKPHQCPQCGKRFTLPGNLKDHIQTIHHKVFNAVCPVCKKGFRRKKELAIHTMNVHTGNAPKLIPLSLSQMQKMSSGSRNVPILPAPDVNVITEVVENMEASEERVLSGTEVMEGAESVQYIVATPEMLHAFGIDLEAQIDEARMEKPFTLLS